MIQAWNFIKSNEDMGITMVRQGKSWRELTVELNLK